MQTTKVPCVSIANKHKFLFTIIVNDGDDDELSRDDGLGKDGAPNAPQHTLFAHLMSARGGSDTNPEHRRWFAIGMVAADKAEILIYNWATSLTDRLSSFVEQYAGWARQRESLLQRILYQVRTTAPPDH